MACSRYDCSRLRALEILLSFLRVCLGPGVCNVAPGLISPFKHGDRLTEVDGTALISKAMRLPSLILGGQTVQQHLLTVFVILIRCAVAVTSILLA